MLACAASIGVALAIRKGVAPYTKGMTGAKLALSNTSSAFVACSLAGFLNAGLMRYSEIGRGIDVVDPENPEVVVGKSQIAAKKAVL